MNKDEIEFNFLNQTLLLSASKAIFWKETGSLLLSDVHLGKAGHFRKAGIPVPSGIHHSDLRRMDALIGRYSPQRLLLLGDLFHSDKNNEWDDFIHWRKNYPQLKISLILGNHDVISRNSYLDIDLEVMEKLSMGPFTFTHQPKEELCSYNLAGHVHPGIHLSGRSRQSIKLPCFYFGKKAGLLPAFGNFTGNIAIPSFQEDKIFAITPKAIMTIQ